MLRGGVGERYLYFLLLRLLTFLVAIDSSCTFTVYWLWVIVGGTTVCWLTTFLPKDCVGPLSAGGTWEIIGGCSIGASPVWSLVVAGRVVPSACCLAPSIVPCMVGWASLGPSSSLLWGHSSPFFHYLQGCQIAVLAGCLYLHSSSFKISSNRISLESIWVDLTIYGDGSVGCCSPPIADEGDGALEVVPPCLKLPMGRSSSKSLSTLKTFAWARIGDPVGGACAFLPFAGGNIPHAGIFRGECICLSSCTLSQGVAVLGGDCSLVTCCLQQKVLP
jgi:hypothetical protein